MDSVLWVGWFLKKHSGGIQPKDTGLRIQKGKRTSDCENIHFTSFQASGSSPEKRSTHIPVLLFTIEPMSNEERNKKALKSKKCDINMRDSSYFIEEILSSFSKAH